MFEKLIEKCADGEGKLIERCFCNLFFQSAINKKTRELQSLKDSLQTITDLTAPSIPDNLWDKFSQRVAQEQYAETFLGKRTETNKKRFSFAEVFSSRSTALPWATLGGATAVILLSLVGTQNPQSNSQVATTAFVTPLLQGVQPVSVGNSPRTLSSSQPSSVPVSFDVDWVRSQGKVNISRSANGDSPIFWVSKRPNKPEKMPGATPYVKVGKAFPARSFPQ